MEKVRSLPPPRYPEKETHSCEALMDAVIRVRCRHVGMALKSGGRTALNQKADMRVCSLGEIWLPQPNGLLNCLLRLRERCMMHFKICQSRLPEEKGEGLQEGKHHFRTYCSQPIRLFCVREPFRKRQRGRAI